MIKSEIQPVAYNPITSIHNFFEYIPVVSTATSIATLFFKCAVLPCLNQDTIKTSHFYSHLQAKDFGRCALLLVPIVGNVIVGTCMNRMETKIYNLDYTPPPRNCFIAQDPLTDAKKENIKNFVESYILTNQLFVHTQQPKIIRVGENSSSYPQTGLYRRDIFGGDLSLLTAISKTYDSPNSLKKAEQAMGAEPFRSFRKALKDPAIVADQLGIDPHNFKEIFATRVFMKVIIREISSGSNLDDMHKIYHRKMTANSNSYKISLKNKMLMRNDPLRKLDGISTPLDLILAHTHFIEPNQYYALTREKIRAIMIAEFERLATSQETGHIIEALGTLIAKEKGNILFGSSFGCLKDFNFHYAQGIYLKHHSILVSSMINPKHHAVDQCASGTFIHESLHFLFNQIVGNHSSPTKLGSVEEQLLDQALEQDIEHRKNFNLTKIFHQIFNSSHGTLITRGEFVNRLEKCPIYFSNGCFNPAKADHLHTMRVEAIVRIMQCIAQGISRENIQSVAPNLCTFYYTYSKPLLERYTRDNAHLFSLME